MMQMIGSIFNTLWGLVPEGPPREESSVEGARSHFPKQWLVIKPMQILACIDKHWIC